MDLNEKLNKRAALLDKMRAIHEVAKDENRSLTAEETQSWTRMKEDRDAIKAEVDRETELREAEREAAQRTGTQVPPNADEGDGQQSEAEVRMAAFNRYMTVPSIRNLTAEEVRALEMGQDSAGGYTVPPEQFQNELLTDIASMTAVRGIARVITLTSAKSLGVPSLTARMNTAAWGSEIAAPTADATMAFGKRILEPKTMTAEILVSKDLVDASPQGMEVLVREDMARDMGELEEAAFCTGSGANQPLGIFTASADGVTTARDMSTGNNTTAPTFDGLKRAKHHINAAYRKAWLAHPDFALTVDLLKDGEGRYIWQDSVMVGQPDVLLGLPVYESESAPNTFTTGLYVAAVGDFSKYWIVDSLDMGIQRLDELNARTNQYGFIARRKVDGAPVLANAFARVKLG
jgi:HK97 family phage major capsid protein